MKGIPPGLEDLWREETRAYAYLATLMPDGSPQVTPVWFSVEGEQLLVNTAMGRIKDRTLRERSQVALVLADPRNPYRYIQVRGRVVGIGDTSSGVTSRPFVRSTPVGLGAVRALPTK